MIEPQYSSYFCEPDALRANNCSVAHAIEVLRRRYALVGLAEEMSLTVQGFERALPRWFIGASAQYQAMQRTAKGQKRLATPATNNLTGTTMTGAISSMVRQILAKQAVDFAEEVAFYQAAKQLFWHRLAALGVIR